MTKKPSSKGARSMSPRKVSVPNLQTLYFEDLEIGRAESLFKTIMDEDILGFAEISGDFNPVHISEAHAAQSLFGQRIAHGILTASLISAVIGTRLPGPGAIYLEQTLKFRRPVMIGDVVYARVEVIDLIEKGSRAVLYCECTVDQNTVLEGEAKVVCPRRPAS